MANAEKDKELNLSISCLNMFRKILFILIRDNRRQQPLMIHADRRRIWNERISSLFQRKDKQFEKLLLANLCLKKSLFQLSFRVVFYLIHIKEVFMIGHLT